MAESSTVTSQIRTLEERLLDPGFRHARSRVEPLLASDYVEIGSDGWLYDKRQRLEELSVEPPMTRTMSDFTARRLGRHLVLVVYRTKRRAGATVHETLRSSLWQRSGGSWILLFHQGTVVDRPK